MTLTCVEAGQHLYRVRHQQISWKRRQFKANRRSLWSRPARHRWGHLLQLDQYKSPRDSSTMSGPASSRCRVTRPASSIGYSYRRRCSCVIVNLDLFRQACNNVTVYQQMLVCFVENVFKLGYRADVTKLERVGVLFSCTSLFNTSS